jgi:hypothetical protein
VVPVLEGERSMWGCSWFPHRGAAGGWSDAAVADNRSQTMFGLTRGGRQSVGPVRLKGCLGQMLLWRSNRLSKWNGL